MSDPLIDAFEDCLRAMEAGATLEAALARHPQLAAELRPMLLAARAAQPAQPIRVPHQSETASHARLIARARGLRQSRSRAAGGWWTQFSLVPRLAFAVLALALVGWGAVTASASSLPGDALYGVKRTVERAQLSFTPAEARPALEAEFEQRRVEEVRAVLDQRREAEVEFTGSVEAMNGEQWTVGGIRVNVAAELGAGIMVGDRVRVTGHTQADGSVRATIIQKLSAGVAPTATPQPSATPTPSLTDRPEITETETQRTMTQSPNNTPLPGSTPTLTAPPTQTLGSGPSPSNTPANTVPPTHTPTVPSPSNTPQPSETEKPEEVEFEGTLQSTSPWTVDGQTFTVDGQTEIRDNPQVGDRVRVRAYRLTNGVLLAYRVEKR